MPRIKRWFPVSHDINHSATMRELAREFGLAGWRIWLEILSISDRAGDVVDCTSEGALSRLTSAAETRLRVTSRVIEWLLSRNCIATVDQLNHTTRVVNYWDFHRTPEQKRIPPDLPDLTRPNQTNKKPPKSPKGDSGYDLKFELFWKEYPRKSAKDAAYKAWNKKVAAIEGVAEKIMEVLPRHKRQEQWKKDDGEYIPHASTWLNQSRWNDEIPERALVITDTREEARARHEWMQRVANGEKSDVVREELRASGRWK